MLVKVNLLVSNNQLESRMREIRQSGSVGGKPQPNAASLPQSFGAVADEMSRFSMGC